MKDNILHRKILLIITTIDIIDELGIQGLSTREIAKRQGVSEATIFRHYKNKNELLLAVLDYFSQFDEDIFQSTRIKGLGPKESILFLVKSSAEYYENYPAITAIMQMFDVLRYETGLRDKVTEILNKRYEIMKSLIEDAQSNGELREDLDGEELSNLILGYYREICLRWRFEEKSFSLKDKTLSVIERLLETFSL